jgi:hypothetical protein
MVISIDQQRNPSNGFTVSNITLFSAFILAPFARSTAAVSTFPAFPAHISGVLPSCIHNIKAHGKGILIQYCRYFLQSLNITANKNNSRK